MSEAATVKPKDAASFLGLSTGKVYTLARTGKLTCYRFDGAVRFDRADLEAYKTSCRSPATTPANGSSSLIASSPERGHALTVFFQKAGRKSKPKSLTASKPPASMHLQLVSQSPSR